MSGYDNLIRFACNNGDHKMVEILCDFSKVKNEAFRFACNNGHYKVAKKLNNNKKIINFNKIRQCRFR